MSWVCVCATMLCQEGVVNSGAIKSHKNKKFYFTEIGNTYTKTHALKIFLECV